jgi:hypothetical protein
MRTVAGRGGLSPTWRGDGRELYYLGLDGKLMAVPIKEDRRLDFGNPTVLFQSPPSGSSPAAPDRYDVSADGKRFVFIVNDTDSATPNDSGKFSVILNWTAAFHKE